MKVILKADIQGIGKKNDVVTVKEGYAKNFLFKQNLGVEATQQELDRLEKSKLKLEKQEIKKLEEAKRIADQLSKNKLTIKVKAGDNGKIFGSVTSKEISELITEKTGIEVDKKKVSIEENHIKTVGSYKIIVKLHTDVKAEIELKVEGE